MNKMLNFVRRWTAIFIAIIMPSPPRIEIIDPAPEMCADLPAALPSPGSRKERRAQASWERKRRKADKFVEPKGPRPVKIQRSAAQPKKPGGEGTKASDGYSVIKDDDGRLYHEREFYGEFTFRDTILEQLDKYWIYLARMKKRDPGAFGLYSELGAQVVPPLTMFLHRGVGNDDVSKVETLDPISPWWRTNRPGFGCVTYGITSTVEEQEKATQKKRSVLWVPKFLYFTKYESPPPEVQPTSGGDVYGMTIWWDQPFNKAAKGLKLGGTPEQYAIFINKEGTEIKALPMLESAAHDIPSKKNGLVMNRVSRREWRLPKAYTDWAKRTNSSPNVMLCNIFLRAAHAYETTAYSMIRVAVHHKGLTAIFSVDVKRVPYFFQDRDITLTENGLKKRIFHIVRPHERITAAGIKPIKFHFRGLREFAWAGYEVKITVPQRDHLMLHDFDLGSVDEFWHEPGTKYIAGKQLAGRLTKWMSLEKQT